MRVGRQKPLTNVLLNWHTTPWLALSASLWHWFLSLQVWRKCCDERLKGREMKGGWIKNREVKNLILHLSLSRGKKNKTGRLGYPPSLLSTSDLWSFTQTWQWSDLGLICNSNTVSSNPPSQLLRVWGCNFRCSQLAATYIQQLVRWCGQPQQEIRMWEPQWHKAHQKLSAFGYRSTLQRRSVICFI